MNTDRLALLRAKNSAFHAWCIAVRRCERKRHSVGTVPTAWLDRLEELRQTYYVARDRWRSAAR